VVGQAQRFSGDIVPGVKPSAEVMQQAAREGLGKTTGPLGAESPAGDAANPTADLRREHSRSRKTGESLRAPTAIIREGQASKPTEFGKMVKIQEGENQIITD
jgi:IS5 family transposase